MPDTRAVMPPLFLSIDTDMLYLWLHFYGFSRMIGSTRKRILDKKREREP